MAFVGYIIFPKDVLCNVCGKTMQGYPGSKSNCCSKACQQKYRWKKKADKASRRVTENKA